MRLLPSQKTVIVQTIRNFEFSLSGFDLNELDESSNTISVYYKNTDFYYSISTDTVGNFIARYSPAEDKWNGSNISNNWEDLISSFEDWLVYLKREVGASDEWGLIQDEINNLYTIGSTGKDDTKFTTEEYKVLEVKIEELKDKIAKLDLLESQLEIINKKLDDLLIKAKSMNKIDWKNLLVGSVLSLIFQLSIDTNTGREIFGLAKNLFQNTLQLK